MGSEAARASGGSGAQDMVAAPEDYQTDVYLEDQVGYMWKLMQCHRNVSANQWLSGQNTRFSFNPLKTSPKYTRAGVYGKCVL